MNEEERRQKVIDELLVMDEVMKTVRDAPMRERVKMMTRLCANFLYKRGKLPDHLKKFTDN